MTSDKVCSSYSLTMRSASGREIIYFCVAVRVKEPGASSSWQRLSSKSPCMIRLVMAWLHPIARSPPHATPVNVSGDRGLRLPDKLEDGLCLCQVPVRHCDDGNACPAVCLASANDDVAGRNVVVVPVIACHAFGCDPQVAVHLGNIRVTR
jgi:hypothetical protein